VVSHRRRSEGLGIGDLPRTPAPRSLDRLVQPLDFFGEDSGRGGEIQLAVRPAGERRRTTRFANGGDGGGLTGRCKTLLERDQRIKWSFPNYESGVVVLPGAPLVRPRKSSSCGLTRIGLRLSLTFVKPDAMTV